MTFLELMATLKLDKSEYDKGLGDAKSSVSKVASGIGSAVTTMGKVTAAAIGVAATGVATLTAKAVEGYAEYEQLEGGIETLFGTGGKSLEEYADSLGQTVDEARSSYESLENAQSTMMENASNAYKTAGLSANEYMDTAISMSASMISALGGDTEAAAAEVDMAITDMSDNVNKMGTSMESIQNAYTGFAKGNYTMLDNLALGYGGTKEEMERLIEDAEKLDSTFEAARDTNGDLEMSYNDIVDAIHIVQTDMGITGTTALEASTTISGSLNQAKAAWSNLVTGLADDNANIEELSQNLIDSLVGYTDEAGNEVNGFIDNIIPVIETALDSIGTLIEEMVPKIVDILNTMLNGDLLNNLTESATSLVQGFVDAISNNMDTISSVLSTLINAIVDLIPDVISIGGQIISTLATAIMDNLDPILDAASQILEMLLTGLSEHAGDLVDGATQIITKLVGFLTDNADLIIDSAVTIVMTLATALLDNLPTIVEAGLNLFVAIVEGIVEALPTIIEALPDLIDGIINAIIEMIPDMIDASTTLFMAMVDALPEIMDALNEAIPEIIDSVIGWMTGEGMGEILDASITLFSAIYQALPQIAVTVISGIGTLFGNVVVAIAGKLASITNSALSAFGGIATGLAEAVTGIPGEIASYVSEWLAKIKSTLSDWTSIGKNLISSLWNGFKSMIGNVNESISSWATSIVSSVKSKFGIASPSKVFTEIGAYMAEGLGVGWENEIKDVNKQIDEDLQYEGEIDVATNVTNTVTTTQTSSMFTDSDLTKLADMLSIHFTNNTYVDGKMIKQESYDYTVERMGNETRATTVAQGGYYQA